MFTLLSLKQSENKNLAALVLSIPKFQKTVLKRVTADVSSNTCFVYITPPNKLKN